MFWTWMIPIMLIILAGIVLWIIVDVHESSPSAPRRGGPTLALPPARRLRPSDDLKSRLYSNQMGRCIACEQKFSISALQVDHVVPVARGGHDGSDNLQLLCGRCNRLKGARTHRELLNELRRRGII